MSRTTKPTSVSIKNDLLERAQQKAAENFQSLSAYISQLIVRDLRRKKGGA